MDSAGAAPEFIAINWEFFWLTVQRVGYTDLDAATCVAWIVVKAVVHWTNLPKTASALAVPPAHQVLQHQAAAFNSGVCRHG